MRLGHFDTLRPVCPSCLVHEAGAHDLEIGWVAREDGDGVQEGALHCTNPDCRSEYPILDGLPILVPDPRAFIADHAFSLLLRDDLDPRIESVIGECSGPGSAYDATRIHLSSYSWDHYGDLAPDAGAQTGPGPGSIVQILRKLVELGRTPVPSPVLEVGCSVGRTVLELAETGQDMVLGVDLNVSMLRVAQRALRSGRAVFPKRRAGLLYERQDIALPFESREAADFWVADGTMLPFRNDVFGSAVALNVIDSVSSPLDLLRTLERITGPGGSLYLTTPYDWSAAVTPLEAWLGGHSPRAPGAGDGAWVLRALLTPGAHPASLSSTEIVGELPDLPWTLRMHDRSRSEYSLHGVVARIQG
ncbi:MAG: methyltransferase domain-containing protein [Candidatus Eisenbacteria bacterium]